MTQDSTQPFQAEVSEVLRLVIDSLYSHKEVFMRELVSNAADALDRRRFESLIHPELLDGNTQLRIRILIDEGDATISINDNGIGMSAEELAQNLGTIARSGTREFLKGDVARKADGEMQLIGQFGVGFYSSFLVADRVTVLSRRAGSEQAAQWVSDGRNGFTVDPATRDEPGTTVTLKLKAEQGEFLQEYRVHQLVERYSDYIDHGIELARIAKGEAEPKEWTTVNRRGALWQRNPKEVTDEQLQDFYKHLTHDWEAPRAHRHFRAEGTQMFTGLLFLPAHPPFDLFDPSSKHGVRLHVKRIMVMESSEELLPKWLRFIRGLVDSEDLPLNVSRETLQDSRTVRIIRKQVVNHSLAMLEEIEHDRPEQYAEVWQAFGAVLKEGLHFEPEEKDRLAKLLRFSSSTEPGLVSLASYVSRMKEGQEAIYYALGPSAAVLAASPHLEVMRARGFEVLFLTDPVDPFAISNLQEFDGHPIKDAMAANLELPKSDTDPKQDADASSDALLEKMKTVLSDRVGSVRASSRLSNSPVCLVAPEGALAPHIERMLRARQMDVPETKRILEVNRDHPVVVALRKLLLVEPSSPKLAEWIELLYDQALVAEGSPVENPAEFAQRLARLMTDAADKALG